MIEKDYRDIAIHEGRLRSNDDPYRRFQRLNSYDYTIKHGIRLWDAGLLETWHLLYRN